MDFVVSALEMRELDRRTIADFGVPGRTLMEVAGRAVAQVAHQAMDGVGQIAILCGTGNNGGDGFVAARALVAMGHEAHVYILGDSAKIDGDARGALDTLQKSEDADIEEITDAKAIWELAQTLPGHDMVIDAMLGTGLTGDVRGLTSDAIEVINASDLPVVAVDIASGVNSDTGAVMGRAVEADITVTFGFAKRGHYLFPGAENRGELAVADIGIPAKLLDDVGVVARVLAPEDGPTMIPVRRADSHKGSFGLLSVVAGSPDMPGAAQLALGGALRSGTGLVRWVTDETTLQRMPQRPPEVVLGVHDARQKDTWAQSALEKATAVVVGPGFGNTPARVEMFRALLHASTVPMCLDADALNMLAEDDSLTKEIRAPIVLTPHPKEMARLMKTTVDEVQNDRVASALQVALARRCVVVLKGAGTVVAEPDGTAVLIAAGNPGLASGGTGDVLAGIIGGLLAQGYDPSVAARVGALLHAVAADRLSETTGQAGLLAADLLPAIGQVWASWKR